MVSYVIYLHMSFSESLSGFLRYILICLLVSRWVVSYVIYLHMSFSESLGGFLRYILTYVF